MLKAIHPIAGAIALVTILCFWLSTAASELFAGEPAIVTVKTLIPWGFFILIPALMVVEISGVRLSRTFRGPLVKAKQKRMPFIAGNGLVILVPAALFLSCKAQAGVFDVEFHTVQAVELIVGAVNIALLSLNMRDGLRLARQRHRVA